MRFAFGVSVSLFPAGALEIPTQPPPCCSNAEAKHVQELAHIYQFDFDLYQCKHCSHYWVRAWREGVGGWEPVSSSDAEQMQVLDAPELRAFMKQWAKPFH